MAGAVWLVSLANSGADPFTNTSSTDFGGLSLDQLANVRIDIASVRSRPMREQPGIVSVIQAEEIRQMGARDLADILQQVPGFGLGADVNGVVGSSFRGLWAYEGKLQLIVDGVEMNETLYGTTQLGHRLPADAIAEVEIIRGPGSAKYGGTAELAVVRVTTKGAEQNGGYGVLAPSFVSGKAGADATGGFGYTEGDWRVAANAYVGENFRSNRRYTALDGSSVDLTHNSDIASRMVNVGVGWKDLNVRAIYDLYRLEDRINFGIPLPLDEQISFETLALAANYDWQVNDWLIVTPNFSWKRQVPWTGGVPGSTFRTVTERYLAELSAVMSLSENVSLLTGLRFHYDHAQVTDARFYGLAPEEFYNGGTSDSVSYNTFSPYAQLDWDWDWANISVGGRYEYHTAVGGQWVPRLGITKTWDHLHMKALFDRAYRTPNINILNSPASSDATSEQTTSYQFEAGWRFHDGVSLVGNIFYIEIHDPIVYQTDAKMISEGYTNGRRIATCGTELELRYRHRKFSGALGYSLYALTRNGVSAWESGVSRLALGIPAHKVSASATWHILDNLLWNANATLTAEQRAYVFPNVDAISLPPTFLLNTFLEYRWHHASCGIGVANLLNSDSYIAQPFLGGAAPIPGKGREIYLKLGFEF